ncbi:hypothetical protein An08g05810 [Aspergillus niger]|uniref:Uncharacterized protein n=2 Tax=Aspergillus niger TaxID=5061 RepID=A2QRF2_ASPNC|nr:hypothetical protein An08g05810 [Aspergillus niger]CAK45553.1 hypothetical protein An08g05810 [Aspergillus niger]
MANAFRHNHRLSRWLEVGQASRSAVYRACVGLAPCEGHGKRMARAEFFELRPSILALE